MRWVTRHRSIARLSFGLVRSDRRLLLVPAASVLLVWGGSLGLYGAVGTTAAGAAPWSRLVLTGVLAAYPAAFISTFLAVAFVAVVAGRLEGRETTVREGLKLACARRGAIARWALIAAGVGVIVRALQQARADSVLQPVASWLRTPAWAMTAFLGVPILALEEVRLRDTGRRSEELLREGWGETSLVRPNIAAFWIAALAPVALIVVATITIVVNGSAAGGVLVALGCLGSFVLVGIVTTQTGLLSLALYRYAMGRGSSGDFTEADLQRTLEGRRVRRSRRRE